MRLAPLLQRARAPISLRAWQSKWTTIRSPSIPISTVLASRVDGSGAFTIIVVTKDGRKSALAGLLIKHGLGIRDAWVRRVLSKTELREILENVGNEVGLAPSSIEYVAAVVRQALSINLDTENLPPFGALDFAETCGSSS